MFYIDFYNCTIRV